MRMPERVTEKWGANPHHRKPEGSAARVIRGGLVGPKGKAHAGPDGQQVDIPVPPITPFDACGMLGGRVRGETSAVQAGREVPVHPGAVDREASASRTRKGHGKGPAPGQSRKACARRGQVPVPQTDTGRLAEQAKVDE